MCLRHSSLHPDFNAMSGKFKWLKQIIKLRLNNLLFPNMDIYTYTLICYIDNIFYFTE